MDAGRSRYAGTGPTAIARGAGLGLDPHAPWHVVHRGYTVLVTRPDGSFEGHDREGLFDHDCRILSRHVVTVDGEVPTYVAGGPTAHHAWASHLRVARPGPGPEGPRLPQDALELAVVRSVGRGMDERITVRNHGMTAAEAELVLALDADFADLQDLSPERSRLGEVDVGWNEAACALLFDFNATHDGREMHRALRVMVATSDSRPARDGRNLRFTIALPGGGEWFATLRFDSLVDGRWREADVHPANGRRGDTDFDEADQEWRAHRTRLEGGHPVLGPAFERAADDLFGLRAWEHDAAPDAWFPQAGVPTYTGVFGRDSLTAGWQAALLGPEMMRGALAVAAATQADRDSAWHDAEPGKMIHEMRRGPLSELEIIPQRGYYGTQTTPAMFVLALSEYWHWTADTDALRRYRDAALRTFDWAERYGDRDGDGFLEYERRSSRGLKNHGWKDSDEAIRDEDGGLVPNPIATVEEQAYHFIALQRMAEILVALGEDEHTERFLERARTLAKRWQEAFWMEDESFYAMALGPDKRPVRSIGSNPGHALGAGIVPQRHARAVADRLMAPDLFSGWGIRTLSAEHPSYNPWGYHLGTVWPVENATFALGMKRYGLDDLVERLVTAMLSAAGYFRALRLPEALGGHGADESPIPTVYPGSNSPQAWSASATIQLVQVLLGIYPFAPARSLFLIRPRLPDWLEGLTLRHVRVGDAKVSIRFERQADGSAAHHVLDREGTVHVLEVPPPNDVGLDGAGADAGFTDALKRWAIEHAPGRTARAARIALGDLDP